jgi:hypothetical protein
VLFGFNPHVVSESGVHALPALLPLPVFVQLPDAPQY